ncbi:hypothetical protein [Nonomuraea sp. NPDC049624]|uniref:tyrosine-type recombinase/integrase n=1 Tax=Nonomuraea sp. NPDC049624 TaxID=3154354 RepID=UPI003423AEFA
MGRNRRGAEPPAVAVASFDEVPADVLAEMFAQRARLVDADTVNRELSVMKAAVTWWRARGWLARNPISGIERRPAPPDRTRALSRAQIAVLFDLKIGVRERTLWKALYETCARTEEILCLDVEDLLLTDKRGRVTSKGGTIEWVHWQSGTAQLLPRLLKGRTRGPELEARGGWTLHQLRHSALTHEAEDGTNTPTLLARSRHASVRSLERYARPSVDAVAAHVADRDPLRRRKRGTTA